MEREDYVYRAKLAEQAERYEEMVSAITEVSKKDGELSVEERNLLSVAYKNVIGARRTSWRIIKSVEEKDTKGGDGASAALDKQYREQIEEELTALCTEIINLLDETLVPKAKDAESKVFFYKMKGDYYRYQSEFMTGDKRDDASAKSKEAYQDASEAANGLATTHPIRLGLALNFSVFHYEIMNNPKEACKLAKSAFDNAISELDSLSEDSYKDSTLIMQLLRDNLTLWTSDQDPGASEVQDIEDGDN